MEEKKIPKSTHQGIMNLNGFEISCAVLEDGERVIVDRTVANAFGVKGSGAYWAKKRQNKSALLPEYVSQEYLKPYISKKVRINLSKPIIYKNKSGKISEGISARCLPDICDIWITAHKKGALHDLPEKINIISENAYNILKAFAHVGIIALIDEVTGYQDIRVKNALEEILNKHLLEDAKKYEVTYPLELYKAWFKLRNWDWKPENAQKRPGVIGKWTNKYIYERIAPGLLKELEVKNPKDSKGNRKHKHFQYLTDDIGEPRLREFFGGLIALARASTSWSKYIRLVERAYPSFGDQLKIDFEED